MRDILFVGEILASVTHEMQNIMAIIKESGALVDDILTLNGPPRMRHGDKLMESLTQIQEQIGRGRNLMLMLNGFAHAASDYPDTSDLFRFARQICVLAERMARLKECALSPELDGEPLPVQGNALMLMQTMYLGLAAMLASCPAGDTVHMRVFGTKGEAEAVVRISAERNTALAELAQLSPVMAELNGSCRAKAGVVELCYAQAPV